MKISITQQLFEDDTCRCDKSGLTKIYLVDNCQFIQFIQICLRPDPNSIEFYFDVNVFLLANLNEYIELVRNVS